MIIFMWRSHEIYSKKHRILTFHYIRRAVCLVQRHEVIDYLNRNMWRLPLKAIQVVLLLMTCPFFELQHNEMCSIMLSLFTYYLQYIYIYI